MKKRIIGFDLARAYAIFGMFIVNFNMVFGNHDDTSLPGKLLVLFSGHSSTVFVILAGMGVALMTNRIQDYTYEDRKKLRKTILERALFLFVFGMLFYQWWPADILHLYGGYMSIGAMLIFMDKKYYLIAAAIAIAIFHLLLLLIPFETGWNFETLEYTDFRTVSGFLRNTFYNGWNPIFPWFAYFAVGLYLGRLDWSLKQTQQKMFGIGLAVYIGIEGFRYASTFMNLSAETREFINADYIPPVLPFILNTMSFGMMLIAGFMFVSQYISEKTWAQDLARTGQMTLTHYVSHLSMDLVLFALFQENGYTGIMTAQKPLSPVYILLYSVIFFVVSVYFSKLWGRKYKQGPLEMLMRKITG
ncbi:putative membrane protein YeiB [Chryseobacterium rhizosphaerae]|uniref:DUF418 domain-containing protein n=1 Tax=Chryseobacterium rhizosphaerae TaxID=395937 RepID=UPI002866C973|nr:DUF418 domain-containing protein [Chryseobacterium rhizosphaerae]MDR6545849.1 putative membrane protein YeiB [Chryseobacterium rhizosphaerae]